MNLFSFICGWIASGQNPTLSAPPYLTIRATLDVNNISSTMIPDG